MPTPLVAAALGACFLIATGCASDPLPAGYCQTISDCGTGETCDPAGLCVMAFNSTTSSRFQSTGGENPGDGATSSATPGSSPATPTEADDPVQTPDQATSCVIYADCDDGDPCTHDGCKNGLCVHAFNDKCCASDADCVDAHLCTTDRCVGKLCVNEVKADACLIDGSCIAAKSAGPGLCTACRPELDRNAWSFDEGATCDDDNGCTFTDTCTGKACKGSPTCDAAKGCKAGPKPACEDGDDCTKDDFCVGGKCAGGTPDPCDDGNACTADSCIKFAGCSHLATPGPCDDGSACTVSDACAGLSCKGKNLCDDGKPCTIDTCTGSGCKHVPGGTGAFDKPSITAGVQAVGCPANSCGVCGSNKAAKLVAAHAKVAKGDCTGIYAKVTSVQLKKATCMQFRVRLSVSGTSVFDDTRKWSVGDVGKQLFKPRKIPTNATFSAHVSHVLNGRAGAIATVQITLYSASTHKPVLAIKAVAGAGG